MTQIFATLRDLLETSIRDGGFMGELRVAELVRLDRLRQVLIRCNACRLTCAAQDVKTIAAAIDAQPGNWVRDVSLLATDPAYRGDFTPKTSLHTHGPATPETQLFCAPTERPTGMRSCGSSVMYEDCYSDADPGL